MDRPDRGSAGGDGGGTQQYGTADARLAGAAQERQHDGPGVGVADGRDQVDGVGAVQGGRVGRGVEPVERDRFGAGDRGGPPARRSDVMSGVREAGGRWCPWRR
ncbi:hypothetical protein GCM10020256_06000 [Streptomyces thermocoprophilus]